MKINGTISIVEKNGKYGAFNVGTLNTDIGDFVVKTELLDQFDSGAYDVSVIISQIYLGGYRWGNTQNVTQLCANIEYIQCMLESDQPTSSEEFEVVDPVETEIDSKDVEETYVETTKLIETDDAEEILGLELAQAFNNKKSFNLDMTVGRMKLRAQANWLNEHGYQFRDRKWSPKK